MYGVQSATLLVLVVVWVGEYERCVFIVSKCVHSFLSKSCGGFFAWSNNNWGSFSEKKLATYILLVTGFVYNLETAQKLYNIIDGHINYHRKINDTVDLSCDQHEFNTIFPFTSTDEDVLDMDDEIIKQVFLIPQTIICQAIYQKLQHEKSGKYTIDNSHLYGLPWIAKSWLNIVSIVGHRLLFTEHFTEVFNPVANYIHNNLTLLFCSWVFRLVNEGTANYIHINLTVPFCSWAFGLVIESTTKAM